MIKYEQLLFKALYKSFKYAGYCRKLDLFYHVHYIDFCKYFKYDWYYFINDFYDLNTNVFPFDFKEWALKEQKKYNLRL